MLCHGEKCTKIFITVSRGKFSVTKPESITIRVTAKFKSLVFKRAREENRSATSYIEWLVMQDAEQHELRQKGKSDEES